jgi:glycosyltransferase involved in cell wall biosynthesis
MRVLVIDEWVPYPLESGKKIRTFNLLFPLARRHDITYLCYANPQMEAERIAKMEEAGFRVVCVPPVRKFGTLTSLAVGVVSNLPLRTPLAVRKHYSRRFKHTLDALLRAGQFDVAHCEWTHYAVFLRAVHSLPRFLCSHNVECMSWRRFSQVQSNPLRKAGLHLEWMKMKSFERRITSEFDHVAVVSPDDELILRSRFGVDSVEVIPNGVDTEFYATTDGPKESDLLVYCASMDAFVNQDAAIHFVRHILPKIHQRRPQTTFLLVGCNPPPSIQKLASDRVVVTGSVKDVRPLLGKATVSVVPLRVAGGSRLKILEAFAAGLPVVSTPIGAEGLEVKTGRDLLIADDDSAFASECIRLLESTTLRRKFIEAGRKLVKSKYDWGSISPLVEVAWERTIRNYHGDTSCTASKPLPNAGPHTCTLR